MKFYTNKISTNSSGSFSDLIKKIAETDSQTIKTASTTKKAEAGVDDDGEGKRTDVHQGEGSPSDQNGEPEEDKENKTVDPAGLNSSSETEQEVKIASEEGDSGSKLGKGEGDCGDNQEGVNSGRFPEPERECGDCHTQEAEDEGKADVESSNEKQVKEAGELPEALKEHQFGKKDKDDSGDSDDSEAKDEKDEEEKESCSASTKNKLKRIANLTAPEKNRLKEYFRRYYPESYADALTQDK